MPSSEPPTVGSNGFAQHVLLGTDVAAGSIRGPHTVTGVPVRAELSSVRAAIPREPLGVLVCGGSFGSRFLDDAAAPLLRLVAAAGITLDVHHVGDPRCAGAAYERAGIVARVVAFENDMAAAYARASFAIVSAGAVTLAELAAVGLPALVVPSAQLAEHLRQFVVGKCDEPIDAMEAAPFLAAKGAV